MSVYSVSISARATMNLHSLNNEGSEGNQTQTRSVDVIMRDADGNPQQVSVNAISGDMFKHMQAAHLHRISLERGLHLCEACQKFDANRISADPTFREFVQSKDEPTPVQVIDYMVDHCVMDDLEGNLITEAKQATARKSIGEFGWVIGIPEAVTTNEYFHVKYAPDRRERRTDKDEREGNLGQAIFHRPASSGVYAMVCHFDVARIGFNDISQQYVVDDNERAARFIALMESALYTFLEPLGAMRNTQLPHITELFGAVSVSRAAVPSPRISPLSPYFIEDIEKTAENLNGLRGADVVSVHPFESAADLSNIVKDLLGDMPYKFNTSGG